LLEFVKTYFELDDVPVRYRPSFFPFLFECEVFNRLPSATTVHWHGVRLPNEMDGVPNLTQAPIEPGQNFTYRFKAHDAGTYWFHSHMRGIEQIDRGLAGSLIVEEDNPPEVHRDITWFLDDWRLIKNGEIVENFGAMHDVSHGGRIGNLSTVNGVFNGQTQIHAGERIRVRLINIANARIFNLSLGQLPFKVIAVDGQGVTPRTQEIILGPGMRIDLIAHVPQDLSGREIAVVDRYRRDAAYRLHKLSVQEPQRSQKTLDNAILPIAPNPITPIDLTRAVRHEVVLTGGMMGSSVLQQMIAEKAIPPEYGSVSLPGPWTLNGRPVAHGMQGPMLSLDRGVTCILSIVNATAWYHPMHLHGYVFDILQRNGRADGTRADTVLLAPKERVDVAFLADNPGDWMFHCHILEHQIGGMMGYIRVK
ncbi:multicopper oxidase family protein, partial [Thalassospira sp. CH_XMU1420-2]|uniref:multicopper oxidase family protein n=1 Tax=Thalassospira sp. CH_XMU1420-2 TaxID=3107769 RepID=UPI00300B3F38